MRNVKYGKCVRCGKTYDAVPDLTNCACGGILDIVYDYDYIKSVLTKEKLNVVAVSTQSKGGVAHMRFTAEVGNVEQINRTLTLLHSIDGVVGARRA